MNKYCDVCGRKIGFFEKSYENHYCKECYHMQLEKRQNYIMQMSKDKNVYTISKPAEITEREINENIIKLKKEKQEKEERLITEKNYFLYTKYFLNILSKINDLPFHYQNIFKYTVKSDKFKVIELLLKEILNQLPNDYNLTDIKKITTYGRSSQIIDKVLKPYIDRELNYEKYCLITVDRQKYYPQPNNNILNDIEENSIFIDNGFLLNFELLIGNFLGNKIKNIEADEHAMEKHLENSHNPNKYDYSACISFAKENELDATYEIISIYYLYAMLIVYYIYLNKTINKIINESELYDVYKKLKNEIHNNDYIVNKLYPIYNSLYKNEFDIIFENEKEFALLLEIIAEKEKNIEKNNFIDIENSILNVDINKYIDNTDEIDMTNKVINEIAENIVTYKNNLSLHDVLDIIVYSKKYLPIIEEIKKQQAIKEKERILKGFFEEEKEAVNNSLDYSTIDNGYEFESFVANLYKMLGYNVLDVTSKSGDQGADVLIEKDNIKYAIQVKYYNNPVGNKAIQEVVAAKSFYKTDKAMVVTNSTFTPQAITLANANDVLLVDGNKLDELIKQVKNN